MDCRSQCIRGTAAIEGAAAVEYGLLLALVAAVVIATVAVLGQDVFSLFQTVEGRF
jgi:pilus assembly protein Flp/PilA